jgi:hypothetical protein
MNEQTIAKTNEELYNKAYALLLDVENNAEPLEECLNPAEFIIPAEVLDRIIAFLNGEDDLKATTY